MIKYINCNYSITSLTYKNVCTETQLGLDWSNSFVRLVAWVSNGLVD